MENYVTCPHCNKKISNELIIDEAATGAGSAERSINCECGERITYWAITSQLRDQKKWGRKIRKLWQRSSAPAQQ